MQENIYPKIGVGVLIFNDKGEVLLGKRKNSHGEGTWSPPGGHLEFGESLEDCAIRESKEEVDVIIENLVFLGVTNDIFEEQKKHYVTIHFKANIKSGTLKLKEPEKCEYWKWIEWSKFPKNLFLPTINLQKMLLNLEAA